MTGKIVITRVIPVQNNIDNTVVIEINLESNADYAELFQSLQNPSNNMMKIVNKSLNLTANT